MMDRRKQQQVWQRVYGKPQTHRPYSQSELERCYRRELENHRYFDRFRDDPVYGGAFSRLADDALEHSKMLQRILER